MLPPQAPDEAIEEKADAVPAPSTLPREPVVRIRPSHGWVPMDLEELFRYRELLFFLTWRDIKLRYKQTVFGVLWALIQPLTTMILFSFVFGRLAGVDTADVPYPLFAYAGLLEWTFFAAALAAASGSVVGSSSLVTRVYFPRILIPTAAIGVCVVDLMVSLPLLAVMMAYYGVGLTWHAVVALAFFSGLVVLALAVGVLLSALNVRYRDVRYVIPFVLQIWMFASPIIYPLRAVPERWRWVFELNPVAWMVEGSRAALFEQTILWPELLASLTTGAILLLGASFLFRRMERDFADVI